MPPILPGKRAAGTPLAPSVEKAYYRKCIQLKRRLNEVEAENEQARIRRLRLDRAIMKMRLERAFLLEQLSKRVEPNVEGSEASGDEGVGTPPGDRPHRDKRSSRTRQQPAAESADPPSIPPPSLHATRSSSGAHGHDVPRGGSYGSQHGAGASQDGEWARPALPTHERRRSSASRGGRPPSRDLYSSGLPYAASASGESAPISRQNVVAGEGLSAGPAIKEGPDGERRVVAGGEADL